MGICRRLARIVTTLAILTSTLLGGTDAGVAGTTVACHPSWAPQTAYGAPNGILRSVSAVSQTDAWAVGTDQSYTVIEHWNGTTWSRVTSPNPGSGSCDPQRQLTGVTAISSSNVWAVGYQCAGSSYKPLVLHFNGTTWSQVAAPLAGSDSVFLGVGADGPNDIWAIGAYDGAQNHRSLIEHFDGTSWSIVSSPNPDLSFNELYSVTAIAPDDAWATGRAGTTGPITLHWNGHSWLSYSIPGVGSLLGVDAVSGTDVWAVGSQATGQTHAISEHWNGTSWNAGGAADFGPDVINFFSGVRTDPTLGPWAVGEYNDLSAQGQPLVEHEGSSGWVVAPSPSLGPLENQLLSVSSVGGHLWAVGAKAQLQSLIEQLCPMQVLDAGFSADGNTAASIGIGATAIWVLPTTDLDQHSVTDHTGMNLFDSGLLAPGDMAAYRYIAGGIYSIIDTATGHIGSIQVPDRRTPLSGHRTTKFKITWAATAPAGFVFDVAIRRPGSSTYASWKNGVTSLYGYFIPDKGVGAYWFKSRLRQPSAAQSLFGPPVSIKVTL